MDILCENFTRIKSLIKEFLETADRFRKNHIGHIFIGEIKIFYEETVLVFLSKSDIEINKISQKERIDFEKELIEMLHLLLIIEKEENDKKG